MYIKTFLNEFIDKDSFIKLWINDFQLTESVESYKLNNLACLDGLNIINIKNVQDDNDKNNTINIFIEDMPVEVKSGLKYIIENNIKNYELYNSNGIN